MALREPARDPRRYGRAFVPWFALWAALGTGAGAGTGLAGPDDAAPPQASRTEAVRLDGSVLAGSLESVAPDGIRWSEGASATTLAPETLREVRFEPVRVRPALRVPHLRLTLVTGDRILGTFAAPGRDGIQIEHATAGALAIPFEVVRSIETLPAGGDPCLDAAATHPASTEGDRVYVRSGDAYAGVVVEAATEGIRIETERGAERTIPWNALTVVHLQVEPPSRGTPQALFAEIETDDGSRFVSAAYPVSDATGITFALRSVPEAQVKLPMAAVRRIRTRSDRFTYASELAWSGKWFAYYEAGPGDDALTERWWAPRADRRPSGCALRVGSREHARGFGVHAKTRIEVPLDGAWKTFEVELGIDDETQADAPSHGETSGEPALRGDVDAKVLGDEKVLWEAKGVKGGEPARKVGPLDVSGVKVLVLEVDFGAGMNVNDHADWLDPILVR